MLSEEDRPTFCEVVCLMRSSEFGLIDVSDLAENLLEPLAWLTLSITIMRRRYSAPVHAAQAATGVSKGGWRIRIWKNTL